MPKALITGITGQTGSYLAELLLSKGYEVHGIIRRSSNFNTGRINHIFDNLHLHYGDLSSINSITNTIQNVKPDEVYNLGAMSHVKVSFSDPAYAMDVNASSVSGILECLRNLKASGHEAKFYQASSSEMFGSSPPPQSESTIFHPRSPYAVSKVAAYHLAVNYRESYDLFACNGILFNHESNVPDTPVLVKKGNDIRVIDIGDLAPKSAMSMGEDGVWRTREYTPDYEIWDNGKWTKLISASRYNSSKPYTTIVSDSGFVECTHDHKVCVNSHDGVRAFDLTTDDRLEEVVYPDHHQIGSKYDDDIYWMIGLFLYKGYIKNSSDKVDFHHSSQDVIDRALMVALSIDKNAKHTTSTTIHNGRSSDTCLSVKSYKIRDIMESCTHYYGNGIVKYVPSWVYSSSVDSIKQLCDGFRHSDSEVIEFSTQSKALACSILLLNHFAGNIIKPYYHRKGFSTYFGGQKCKSNKINDVISTSVDIGYEFVTITTESGKYSAGTGLTRIFNSPRRGGTFVTKKITQAAANIYNKKQSQLRLGNLDAKRDWGHAADYVRAMWLMLQQPKSDDYVIATGKSYSVKDVLDVAFGHLGLDWHDYVVIDSAYMRPAEVDHLLGDYSKAKNVLGWEPAITFKDLIIEMLEYDLKN